ncbi:hypothetical protein B0H15DRAFT_806819 [Mycena belliarum]|uniref:Uncharacterized protein n=1 Tax=Mycena belliarum TaxID=1033014 RepID=A0AAD6TN64_9AGAR|nr:hypothetical protein B0H15DRAFT_806819 [Mycena belliae]
MFGVRPVGMALPPGITPNIWPKLHSHIITLDPDHQVSRSCSAGGRFRGPMNATRKPTPSERQKGRLARGTTARIWAHNRQRQALSNDTGDVRLGCSPARTSAGSRYDRAHLGA